MSALGGTTTANGPNSTTEQAKEKAQEGAQQAKRTVRDQVDQRSTEAGERVGSTAGDLRTVGEELRKQGKDQPAKLAEQAAQRAESLGDYLQRSDGDTILRDVEDFGRRQPWAVIAGGVALGFAASRFLKASSTRRYEGPPDTSRGFTSAGRPAAAPCRPTTSPTATPTPTVAQASEPACPPFPRRPRLGACSDVHGRSRERRSLFRRALRTPATEASASSSRTWRARPRHWSARRSSSHRPRSPSGARSPARAPECSRAPQPRRSSALAPSPRC